MATEFRWSAFPAGEPVPGFVDISPEPVLGAQRGTVGASTGWPVLWRRPQAKVVRAGRGSQPWQALERTMWMQMATLAAVTVIFAVELGRLARC